MRERKMIWVRMEKWKDKEKVMQNKSKLGNEQIYIHHDRSKDKRIVQRKIIELAREEKKQGKEVKVKFWKISINGKWLRWDDKEKKLMEDKRRTFLEMEQDE